MMSQEFFVSRGHSHTTLHTNQERLPERDVGLGPHNGVAPVEMPGASKHQSACFHGLPQPGVPKCCWPHVVQPGVGSCSFPLAWHTLLPSQPLRIHHLPNLSTSRLLVGVLNAFPALIFGILNSQVAPKTLPVMVRINTSIHVACFGSAWDPPLWSLLFFTMFA